jgi:hypothetical protein
MSIEITFPDGAKKPFDAGITALAIAQGISPGQPASPSPVRRCRRP